MQWFMKNEHIETREKSIQRANLFLENAMAQVQKIIKATQNMDELRQRHLRRKTGFPETNLDEMIPYTRHVINNIITPYFSAIETLQDYVGELK